MSDRRPAVAAWVLAATSIALVLGDFRLASENGTTTPAQTVNLTLIVVAIVGAIVATRLPRDSTGWILCGVGLLGGLAAFLWDYGYRALVFDSSLPFGEPSIWVGTWIWVPAVGAGLPAMLIRMPDGRIPARVRGIDWLGLAGSVALGLSVAFLPGPFDAQARLPNTYAVPAAEVWLAAARWAGYAAVAVAYFVSMVSLIVRLERATGDERQQLKWITSAGVLVTIALLYCLVRQAITRENLFYALTPFFVSTLALPVGIGIAIAKYRLYDIDLVINRTLVYGGLTALLAGLYTFLVGLTQKLVFFSGQRSDIVILLTAFVGAASFTPVKNWLQKAVDKRFAVHDPASVVDSMREQVEVIVNVLDAQRIVRRLVEDSASTYQARFASLTLRDDGAAPFHTFGDPSAPMALRIRLHSQGRQLGVLSLGERRGGAAYSA